MNYATCLLLRRTGRLHRPSYFPRVFAPARPSATPRSPPHLHTSEDAWHGGSFFKYTLENIQAYAEIQPYHCLGATQITTVFVSRCEGGLPPSLRKIPCYSQSLNIRSWKQVVMYQRHILKTLQASYKFVNEVPNRVDSKVLDLDLSGGPCSPEPLLLATNAPKSHWWCPSELPNPSSNTCGLGQNLYQE